MPAPTPKRSAGTPPASSPPATRNPPAAAPRGTPNSSPPVSDREAEQRAVHVDEVNAESARHHLIAIAAYYRAESRGFSEGNEVEDWLAAEAELDRSLDRSKA